MHPLQPTWQRDLINGLPHCRSSAEVGHAWWSSGASSEQHFAVGEAVEVTTACSVVSGDTVVSFDGWSVGPSVTSPTVVVDVELVVEGAEVSVGFVLSGFFG